MNTTTTTTTLLPAILKESMMIGSASKEIYNMSYDSDAATLLNSEFVDSLIGKIVYANRHDYVYVSTQDYLLRYKSDYYSDDTSEMKLACQIGNENKSVIDFYNYRDDSLWCMQPYYGKITKNNYLDMTVVYTYEGLDAPFKIRWSDYHNAYIVAGSHILWKLDDNLTTVTPIYEINGYSIADFEVSESGIICILFNGSQDSVIRIIKNDLYSIVLDQRVYNENLRFCRYCNKGRFYILAEVNSVSSTYSSINYIYNYNDSSLSRLLSQNIIVTTTTTTTYGVTDKAVKVRNPNGGETVQLGNSYDIQWASSKSASDFVKIELYKSDVLYNIISEKTENTGIYGWSVPSDLEEDSDYKIKISWIAASSDTNNEDMSDDNFIISLTATTTTTTTTKVRDFAIGIDYSVISDQVVIVLSTGQYMIFKLEDNVIYGLIDLGIDSPLCVATRSLYVKTIDKQNKVRVFVGSQKYLSDKWDSGEIETDLKSMYYGGGNNLEPGKKYYVNIQVYSKKYGWSEIQISEFTMPL